MAFWGVLGWSRGRVFGRLPCFVFLQLRRRLSLFFLLIGTVGRRRGAVVRCRRATFQGRPARRAVVITSSDCSCGRCTSVRKSEQPVFHTLKLGTADHILFMLRKPCCQRKR